MILSDGELKERVISDPNKVIEAYNWWKTSQWNKINDSLLIDPFEPEEKLGVCCYDLSVGDEYVSLRKPEETKKLEEGQVIRIDPQETVLILTKEYLALPKNLMAMIVPRARWIFEGTLLNATRVDPTWHGKMLVGFTNTTKWSVTLGFGQPFCTCYFVKCTDVENHLTKKNVPHLGRKKIGNLTFSFAQQQRLLRPTEYTNEHLDRIVDSFGYPWDVLQCAIERGKEETIYHLEREVAPDIVEQATLKVTERAYKDLMDLHKEQLGMQRLLIRVLAGFVGVLGVGVVVALLRIVNLV